MLCLAFFSSGLVGQEIKNEPDMPNEKIAFKDVDDIDLGDIPF